MESIKTMFNFFKKKQNKQYLNCDFLNHSIHFFYDNIRSCCSGDTGIIFASCEGDNIKNLGFDEIFKIRKRYISDINANKFENGVPDCCKKCFEIPNVLQNKKIPQPENYIDKVYIQNYMSCNAKCTYCIFRNKDRGLKYYVLPFIKEMIKKKILRKNSHIYLSGGEITLSPEFEDLLTLFISYVENKIEIFTSGIKYSKSIEEALKKDLCSLLISIDSGCSETYFKIKNTNSFDVLISNIKQYISATDNAKNNIILKYIILDEINNNKEEIDKFFNLVCELGIKNVRVDVDCDKYHLGSGNNLPLQTMELTDYFKTKVSLCNLHEVESFQTNEIIRVSRMKYNP